MAKKSLSQLAKHLERKQGQRFHIGMDVHKESYHVAFRSEDGAVQTFVSPADPELLIQMIQRTQIHVAQVAYEAGPTGFGLARALMAAGFPVIVVAPSKVPRPVTKKAKTDRLDCIKLAEYAAKGILKGIAIPTEREESERCLMRRRHEIAKTVRIIKQRIKSLLLYSGAKYKLTWSQESLDGLLEIPLPEPTKESLKSLLRQLKFHMEEKKAIQKMIKEILEQPDHKEVMECLQSVPGVGETTAGTFILEIFNPGRFESSDQVASLVGVCPTVSQSGAGKATAVLVPTGQKKLRSLLVEAAWRWQSLDPNANLFYRRMRARTRFAQKAIVAVARKLATILWRLAVEKRPYRMLNEAA